MAQSQYAQTFAKTSIGTTALALTASAIPNLNGIEVESIAANSTNFVYLGNVSGVTSGTGFQLAAGQSMLLPPSFVANAGDCYVIGSTTGLEVRVIVY